MKPKLSPTQETVLQIIARGNGRPRSFEGAQLRAAGALLNRELIGRKGPSLGYTLTKAGEDYAREAGWLAVSAPAVPVKEATTLDVLNYQLKEQRGRTLRTAELLLEEVAHLVDALRKGSIPTSAINLNTVAFLTADHAKLVTLHDTLELVMKAEAGGVGLRRRSPMELDLRTLNAPEAAIWQSAYGVAFATKFKDWVAVEGLEYTAQTMTAEYAVTVANAAVLRLREWREAHRRPTVDPLECV